MKFLTLLTAATFLLSLQVFSQVNLQEGIVASFSIIGNADDESSNDNNCIIPTGVTLTEDRFGIADEALLLDGQSYLECGLPDALDGLSLPISFSFWYLVTEENINEFSPILFTDDNNGDVGNYYGFFSFFQYQKFWFGYGDGTGPLINDRRGLFSDSLIISDKWTNIIATIDENKNISICINGIDAGGTQNGNSNLPIMHNEDYPVRIGLRSRYGPVYFNGKLDELYIWNRVLTSDEKQEIVKGGLSTSTEDFPNSKLTIFPNPAKNRVQITGLKKDTQKKVLIEVIDLYGRKILSKELLPSEEDTIDVSSIAPGTYTISVKNNDLFKTSVIIISR